MRFWPWPKRPKSQTSDTPVVVFRKTDERAALVFVPGFTAAVSSSWQPFIDRVLEMHALRSWNILGLDYASNRRIDIAGWESDPNITVLAKYLRTEMSIEPLLGFKNIVLVAHSMSGLVVQRALLDDDELAAKVSHLFLYGVPSQGVPAAPMASWLKRQVTDMLVDGPFIAKLRADWTSKYGASFPFELTAIAGDTDDFVGPDSSIAPFPESTQRVVTGNHSTMIRPDGVDHPSVQLLVTVLQGKNVPTFIDSARLAVQRRDFDDAIDRLKPHYTELDDAALIVLAMALDGVGQGEEALRIMDDVYQEGRLTTAEAAGSLAGRIKRRWLVDRRQSDLVRATELYTFGLQSAEANGDHAQGYYHAINLAFLQLMGSDATADVAAVTRRMCRKALDHCAQAQLNHWRLATEGEANLIQGDLTVAEEKYREAVGMTTSVRDLRSMGDQACRIAYRLGPDRFDQVQSWFTAVPQEAGA